MAKQIAFIHTSPTVIPTFKTLAGVSRKYAIPLLEYFDREQITRRAGDKRVILKISGLHSPAPRR